METALSYSPYLTHTVLFFFWCEAFYLLVPSSSGKGSAKCLQRISSSVIFIISGYQQKYGVRLVRSNSKCHLCDDIELMSNL